LTDIKAKQDSKLLDKYQQSLKARDSLRSWYQTPLGNALMQAEHRELAAVLPGIFGYHLLQLSEHNSSSYLASSSIRHQIIADVCPVSSNHDCELGVRMNAHNLAIASDSIDAVILPHTLDVDMNPQQVLRETDRVLVPEGRAVILNFNPWSSWGIRHIPNIWCGQSPYSLRYFSPMRIKDWLALLGFEIEIVKTFFYRLPISNPVMLKKLSFLDAVGAKAWPAFGSVYLIVARKQVSTLTPIRPRWFLRRRSSVTPGFIESNRETGKGVNLATNMKMSLGAGGGMSLGLDKDTKIKTCADRFIEERLDISIDTSLDTGLETINGNK